MVNSNEDSSEVQSASKDALDYVLNVVKISDEEKSDIDMLELRKNKFRFESPARQKKLRRRTKTRGVYGLGDKDWVDARSFITKAIVNILRAHPTESSEIVVNDLIMLNDSGDSISFSWEGEPNASSRSHAEWKNAIVEMVNGINDRWPDNYNAVLSETAGSPVSPEEYEHDLALIRSIPTLPEASWVQWRGIITDPTASYMRKLSKTVEKTVFKQVAEKHKRQRIFFGISDIDISYAKLSYAHWLIVNASIVLASQEAMGYPAGEDPEEWSRKLLKFAEGIYIAGFSGNMQLSVEDEKIRDEAIKNMPIYLNDLWD